MIGSAASSYPPSSFARDRDDILSVFENRHLLHAILAGHIKLADRNGHALRRQRFNVMRRLLGGALDHSRAFLGVAVGDQEIADLFRHRRPEDRFLELRQPLRSARIDLELVAVGARQDLALRVDRRVRAAVVVRAGLDLGRSLGRLPPGRN